MIKHLTVFLIQAVLISAAQAQVENFGENGWIGRNDPLDRVEAYLGGSSKCKKATRDEMNSIDDCLPNYSLVDRDNLRDFDNLSEELIFMEAARRTHQVGICQVKLHQELFKNKSSRDELIQNAFNEFTHIKTNKAGTIQDHENKARDLSSAKQASIGFADDMKAGVADDVYRNRIKAQDQFNEINKKIYDLVARIPMGNRPSMREHLIKLLKKNGSISEAEFRQVYTKGLTELRLEASKAEQFFKKISFPDPTNKKGLLYTVNEDLKKSLARSGQLDNVVRMLGMEEKLADSFVCRAQSRYVTGPRNLTLAEVPFYFMGMYGLGRLGVRATIAAGASAGRLASGAATAARFSSQAAMMGLHSYEWLRAGDAIRESCIPQEFMTASLDDGCSVESEVSGLYQEALSAQCFTNAALVAGPRLAIAGVSRVVAAANKAEVAAAKAIVKEEEEIVVTAQRPPLVVKGRPVNKKDYEKVQAAVGTKLDDPVVHLYALDELSSIKNLNPKAREAHLGKLVVRLKNWDAPTNKPIRALAALRSKKFEKEVATLKAKQLKKEPNADEDELTTKAERDIFAKRERKLELGKVCSAKGYKNADMEKAASNFKKYHISIGVLATVGTYSYKHWDDVKNTKFAMGLGYEVTMSFISSWISAKLFTSSAKTMPQKWASANISGFTINSAEGAIYNSLFSNDEKKAQANFEKISKDPNFKQHLKELEDYLEKQKEIDQFAHELRDLSSTVVSAAMGKDASAITAEELRNFDEKQLEDPEVKERVMKAISDKYYAEGASEKLRTGSKGTDRLAFNTAYSLPMSVAGLAVQYFALKTLCLNIDQPKKAMAMFFGIQAAQRVGFGALYYGERKDWINQ